jgi:hypothetical protein
MFLYTYEPRLACQSKFSSFFFFFLFFLPILIVIREERKVIGQEVEHTLSSPIDHEQAIGFQILEMLQASITIYPL